MAGELLLNPSDALVMDYVDGVFIWDNMALGDASAEYINAAWGGIEEMSQVKSLDGSVTLGWDYPEVISRAGSNAATDIVSDVSSNSLPALYSPDNSSTVMIPAYSGGGGGNDYTVRSGAFNSGGDLVSVVADKVKLAVAGVSLGTKLGMKFDSVLYNSDPTWWDTHFPSVNPETWGQLATIDGPVGSIAGFALRTFFGIDPNNNAAQYLSADALAYTYMMLRDMGALDENQTDYTYPDSVKNELAYPNFNYDIHTRTTIAWREDFTYQGQPDNIVTTFTLSTNSATMIMVPNGAVIAFGNTPFTVTITYVRASNPNPAVYTYNSYSYTRNGVTYYYHANLRSFPVSDPAYTLVSPITFSSIAAYNSSGYWDVADIIYKGTPHSQSNVPGINKQSGGAVPNKNVVNGTTVPQVKQQLKDNYPDLFTDSITSKTLQDDGTIKEDEYVRVPTIEDSTKPVTGDKTQTDTEITPEEMDKQITKQPVDDPPDAGSGSGPSVVVPTGSASSLWAVYNPTQGELNSFGSWLWSSDFVDQLKKLFVDPMQAIIGVHKVFAPVPTSGTATIKCGYLDSNVSASVVSSQYTDIDCGSVYCGEYFGNVYDYEPYTKVSIYLPFIGVVQLKTSEVMRSNVHVTYGVDVITGACLAKVKINRDGGGGVLYSYGGSCACHYPISSGSYSGIISGIATAAVGIAAGVATASPLAAVGGVLAGARQAHADVQHSGGFTGCSGAMGPKKPYLIIVRPQPKMAQNYDDFQGIPSNTTTYLAECDGYVTVKEAHIIAPHAYEKEIEEINALLKDGVIINKQYPISN